MKQSTENKYNLIFKKLLASDIGTYKIVATNKCGTANIQSNLNVLGAPVITKKPKDEILTPEKKSIKIEFEVNGLPIPDVQWYNILIL